MNALFTIDVYKLENTWYFDDASRNIQREAFVLGASELITGLLGADKTKGTVCFSTGPIPNYDIFLTCTEKCYPNGQSTKIEVVRVAGSDATVLKPVFEADPTQAPDSGWYVDEHGNTCWLCPAQLAFFEQVADTIYIKKLS